MIALNIEYQFIYISCLMHVHLLVEMSGSGPSRRLTRRSHSAWMVHRTTAALVSVLVVTLWCCWRVRLEGSRSIRHEAAAAAVM